MKNKVPIIGLSHQKGILMFGGGKLCSAKRKKNGDIKLSSRKWLNIKPKGFILLLTAVLLMSFWEDTSSVENIGLFQTMLELLVMTGILVVLIWVSRKTPLKKTFQYHSAEHMVLSAYSKGLPNRIEIVKFESRVSPSCGGMLVVPFILMAMVYTIAEILVESELVSIVLLLVLMLFITTYRFSVIPFINRRIKRPKFYCWLDKAGLFFQEMFTTLPPEDDDIELSMACLDQLLLSIKTHAEQ